MASYLEFEGKYNPDRRFVIKNWTDQDLKSFWDSRPITIKAGDMGEFEHAIAYKLTKELVDREMLQDAYKSMVASGAIDHAAREKVRERGEMAVLNKDLRKPYEDKTISELIAGQENPILTKMRAEVRAEMEAEQVSRVTSTPETSMQNDIAATKGESTTAPAPAVTPAKKRGRPAAVRLEGEFAE